MAREVLKQATWLEDYDPLTTVYLTAKSHGLRMKFASPQARSLLGLCHFSDSWKTYNREASQYLDDMLSYYWLHRLGVVDQDGNGLDQHPLLMALESVGLDVVVDETAMLRLRYEMRKIERSLVPFEFTTPSGHVEISGDNQYESSGPFVPEVYPDEYKRYQHRIKDLGLLDGDNFKLFKFQAHDIAQAACKRTVHLGHEMGLGKSVIAAGIPVVVGAKRVLLLAPGQTIGSTNVGWKHEIACLGVPEENIKVVKWSTDLPQKNDPEPKSNWPYFYIIPYSQIASERWEIDSPNCPERPCNHPACKKKGLGDSKNHKWKASEWGGGLACPKCFRARFWDDTGVVPTPLLPGSSQYDSDYIEKMKDLIHPRWTGNYCDPDHGGCGYRYSHRIQRKAGELEVKPLYKMIKPWMFSVGIFDESHQLASSVTRRSQAVLDLPPFKRTIIMTGTMLTNCVRDSYTQILRLFPDGHFPVNGSLLKMSTSMDNLTSSHFFVNRFLRSGQTSAKIPMLKDPSEYWSMQSRFQIRRRENDPEVHAEIVLPAVKHTIHLIEMDPMHQKVWRLRVGETRQTLLEKATENGTVDSAQVQKMLESMAGMEVRNQLTGLRKLASCPNDDPLYTKWVKQAAKMSLDDPSVKDARLIELVLPEQALGNKVIVFGHWITELHRASLALKAEGISTEIIGGVMSMSQKWELLDKHASGQGPTVLLATIGSLGEGVNLTPGTSGFDCRTVIFLSPNWSPYRMDQAWKRIHRIGQTSDVTVHYLYYRDTIEEILHEKLDGKRRQITLAIDHVEVGNEESIVEVSYAEIAAWLFERNGEEMIDDSAT